MELTREDKRKLSEALKNYNEQEIKEVLAKIIDIKDDSDLDNFRNGLRYLKQEVRNQGFTDVEFLQGCLVDFVNSLNLNGDIIFSYSEENGIGFGIKDFMLGCIASTFSSLGTNSLTN